MFPGLDPFPNIGLTDLGVQHRAQRNSPQSGIENNYQVVNNVTYLAGNHSFKFGGDFRNIISPQHSCSASAATTSTSTTEASCVTSVLILGERNVGGNPYYGNQKIFFAFAQDDWRIRPNLTLNLGVSYSYQEVPLGANSKRRTAIASVPGLIEFRAPKSQNTNFAPKVGFAYSPDFTRACSVAYLAASGKSSIRAGFSMGYD